MKPIYEQVKELENSHKNADKIIGECRATMIVNYGPDGKVIKGLVAEPDGLLQMIVSVFRHYHNRDKLFEEMVKLLQSYPMQLEFPRDYYHESLRRFRRKLPKLLTKIMVAK